MKYNKVITANKAGVAAGAVAMTQAVLYYFGVNGTTELVATSLVVGALAGFKNWYKNYNG